MSDPSGSVTDPHGQGGLARLTAPVRLGARDLPSPILLLIAAIGAALLLIVAVNRWGTPSDEYAYWSAAQRLVAGQPLYFPELPVGTPYVYLYPPPLAQVLAPFTLFVSDAAFMWAWTAMLLGCLWLLGLRRVLLALALVAFLPVAVELWFRNVQLLLALLAVLALRRHPAFWVPAAAIKITPVIGLFYLVARGRVREAALVVALGLVVLVVSVILSPSAWAGFVDLLQAQGGGASASIVPVPYWVRLAGAAALAVLAGRMDERRGEVLLVVALVLGNTSLTMTAFSMLVAIVPLWLTSGSRRQPAPA
jgi:hypothetical protein